MRLPSALRNIKEDIVLEGIKTKFKKAADEVMGYIATGELNSTFWKLILHGRDDIFNK